MYVSLLFAIYRYQLTEAPTGIATTTSLLVNKQPVALGESVGAPHSTRLGDSTGGDALNAGASSDEDALQARLDALRRS